MRYQFPALLWVLVIFGLSSIQRMPVIKSPISVDKIAHLVIFFVLCLLLRRALYFQASSAWLQRHSLLLAFVLTSVYGALDEYHQQFVPGRVSDVNDAIADAVGGLIFTVGYWLSQRRRQTVTTAETKESV